MFWRGVDLDCEVDGLDLCLTFKSHSDSDNDWETGESCTAVEDSISVRGCNSHRTESQNRYIRSVRDEGLKTYGRQ